jgi:cytochrome c-type biogenesis protein CcmE
MTKRQNRGLLVFALVCGVSLVVYLGVKTFNENLLYFFSPTDVIAGKAPKEKSFKLGGLVKDKSVARKDLDVEFVITDNENEFVVKYTGILPDLFREGQGIIATGKINSDNIFIASEILAKHDENYMPPEVAATLKKKHIEGVKEKNQSY